MLSRKRIILKPFFKSKNRKCYTYTKVAVILYFFQILCSNEILNKLCKFGVYRINSFFFVIVSTVKKHNLLNIFLKKQLTQVL